MEKIKNFFYAKTLCIVGASSKEKSIGYEILKTIGEYGYRGKVYPVNPKAESILGYKCYRSIEEIDDNIELAIVVVPKIFVEDTIDSLLKKGIQSIILITAGFRETGTEGKSIEEKITKKIKDAGARLVGPNCMGVINTFDSVKLNATFVAENPERGGIGFLSQSGALGAAVLNSLRETDIRFAHFISVGNKADVNENDLLKFWQSDENIKTIALYLESFVNGFEFIKPVVTGEAVKPLILLKAGRTSGGIKAASSHTGALGSKDKVVDALLKQFGMIRAYNINELFNTAKGFEYFPVPQGNRIAVVTNAGGPAILTVDSLEKAGLVLAELTAETRQKLEEVVNPEGSIENPVDLLPGGNAEVYQKVNEMLLGDDNVDAVISIFVQPVMVKPMEVIKSVYDVMLKQSGRKFRKPVLQVCMPLPEFWDEYRENNNERLPVFRNPEEPAAVISNMLFYTTKQKKLEKNRPELIKQLELKKQKGFNFKSGFLTPQEVNEICLYYGLPVVKNVLIEPSGLTGIEEIFYPLVLKRINHNVIHKAEFNAVKLNIRNKNELLKSAEDITNSFRNNGYEVEEFLIQPYINTKHELLLGGFHDPSFGPVLMFGTGGKYVEVINDTSMRSALLSGGDIDEMIDETAIGKILRGVRGERGIDLAELKNIISAVSRMMLENDSIVEFDLNPLIVDKDEKLHAVDVRIKID